MFLEFLFLQTFYTEFIYDDKIIFFYSNHKFENIEWDKIFCWKKSVRYLFYLILILFFSFSILYLRILLKKKKEKVLKNFPKN